ncbi:type III restriction-modification system modification subunit [Helicobacter cinaedi PAGU611]|uniref:site-specific DNA-methyltransferase n=1 Tax=Helicobacter cinaedi TaxID=213 RepID=UPI00025D360F|nr:site-specific DNA-methyltransferase [Helicobacter cinaedi]BAM15057.1 type III restriction-modification system modification subunit [Helicobacter cinaedi PAGU611]
MLDRFHKLKEHFPQCFDKNGDLMPHKLQKAILDLAQEINAQANTATQDLENEAAFSLSKESYSLNWLGKSYAKLLRHLPTHTLIAQDSAHNAQPQNANSKNVLIKGDNLEVLKHLKNAYYRKVKMIYIDPPYNTGNGDFIYNDERSFTPQSLAQMANIELEEASSILNLTLKNSSTHSAWLSFMYPRLYIARQLLHDDGVIFISIDDNEQANLKLLCDEIFGEENFVGQIIWQKKKGGGQDSQDFAKEHEYILCYSKYEWKINDKKEQLSENKFNKIINGKKAIISKLEKWGIGALMEDAPSLYYPIKDPNGNDFYPIAPNGEKGRWRKKPENLDSEYIYWQENSKGRLTPYEVIYFDEVKDKEKIIKTRTIFTGYGTTTDATKEILNLFNNQKIFDTPKPTNLIKTLLQLSTTPNSNDIILDFFAGSGTTAQAVMELNAEDNGNREFILVQLDEVIDKSKSKTAYEFCKNELGSENPTIFDITKERIKRASAKIAQNSNLDLGFKIYELRENDFDSQNGALFKEVDKNALLESFRLQDSTPLSVENQTIDLGGYKAIRAGEKLYLLNSGFEMKHLQKLISLIDAQKDFVIKEISYLNDAFESARIREIEEGIKSYSNKKELKILVRARFA